VKVKDENFVFFARRLVTRHQLARQSMQNTLAMPVPHGGAKAPHF
jgi:hypothetical protein